MVPVTEGFSCVKVSILQCTVTGKTSGIQKCTRVKAQKHWHQNVFQIPKAKVLNMQQNVPVSPVQNVGKII